MTVSRLLPLALSLAFAAISAVAQERPADAASAPMAAVAAPMPSDCAKPMKRHDHGADKGTSMPMSMSGPCAAEPAASAAKTVSKPVHDHAKFNKNQ
jgi:hypothetical protein